MRKTKQPKRKTPGPKAEPAITWSIHRAAREFGVSRDTIRRGLQRDNVAGESFTTRQVYDAITGDDALHARKIAIADEDLRERKRNNDLEEGRLLEKEKLARIAAPTLRSLSDLTYQKLENEAPIAMSSVDVPTGRIIGRRMAGELLTKFQQVFKDWKI